MDTQTHWKQFAVRCLPFSPFCRFAPWLVRLLACLPPGWFASPPLNILVIHYWGLWRLFFGCSISWIQHYSGQISWWLCQKVNTSVLFKYILSVVCGIGSVLSFGAKTIMQLLLPQQKINKSTTLQCRKICCTKCHPFAGVAEFPPCKKCCSGGKTGQGHSFSKAARRQHRHGATGATARPWP